MTNEKDIIIDKLQGFCICDNCKEKFSPNSVHYRVFSKCKVIRVFCSVRCLDSVSTQKYRLLEN